MEEFRKKTGQVSGERGVETEAAYPESIEKMSEKWRTIRKDEGDTRNFFERNFLAIGLLVGFFLIALLIVIGGFAFLVWNAH